MFKQYCFLNLKCCCPFTKKTNSFVFLLFIDSLWISQHTSRSHSFPYPFSSALCHCKLASAQQNSKVTTKIKNRKQAYNKRQSKQTNKKEQLKKNILAWKLQCGCTRKSHSIPFISHIFTSKCSLQCVIGLVWDSWLLIYTGPSLGLLLDIYCCLVSWRSCSLYLQVWSLYVI